MQPLHFAGVELYFEDVPAAVTFYRQVLGLEVSDQAEGHYARFLSGSGFVCLERKGSENYPSRDKAVLFFEVADLAGTLKAIGPERAGGAIDRGTEQPSWLGSAPRSRGPQHFAVGKSKTLATGCQCSLGASLIRVSRM